MGSRHHYVSQFHLRSFTDPVASPVQEPWLWVGDVETHAVERRSPKNVAWHRDLFAGPGGLADREAALEAWLAENVEGPAAGALRHLVAYPPGTPRLAIPPPLSRYLAWAAARSLPMRDLYEEWLNDLDPSSEPELVEPPPPGLESAAEVHREFCMEHPSGGLRFDVPPDRINQLRRQGWRLRVGPDDFLDMVHIQAWYFQVRFFPRLTWVLLWAPSEEPFVLSDRPVLWQADGLINIPPAALRHPTAHVVAPLSPLVALFGFMHAEGKPGRVSPRYVNLLSAASAARWVFGSNHQAVLGALQLRAQRAW